MVKRHEPGEEKSPIAPKGVAAGEFARWLDGTEAQLHSSNGATEVSCGSCRGCCRSSMFVHIGPEEKRTLDKIPRGLLFPAPGLPKGHVVMGYDDEGRCPMLIEDKCSIYEDRPQACRDYDCRVFAATGINVDGQQEIAQRVREWVFRYEGDGARRDQEILKEAAAFLAENRDLFPAGSLPSYPVQVAVMAVRVFRVFAEMKGKGAREGFAIPDAAVASAILAEIRDAQVGGE